MTPKDSEQRLYAAFAALKTSAEAEQFLKDLCTPMEITAMADRWHVVPLIRQHTPYRQIHDLTGVSVTTIGRVARSMEFGAGGYQLIYERLEKQIHEKKPTKNRDPKKR